MSEENYNYNIDNYDDLEDIVDIDPQLFNSITGNIESYARSMDSAKSIISSGMSLLSGELRSKVSSSSAETSLSNIGDNFTVLASTINSSLDQYKKTEKNNYFDMSLYANGVESSFKETGLTSEDEISMTLSEREKMLEEIITNWEAERDKLQAEYDKLYGYGINIEDPDTMRKYFMLLSALDIFTEDSSLSLSLETVGNSKFIPIINRAPDGKIYVDTNAMDYLYNYNKETGIIEKLTAYINGASWEASGLAEFTKKHAEEVGVNSFEDYFLQNVQTLMESWYEDSNFRGLRTSDEIKLHMKEYFSQCDFKGLWDGLENTIVDQMERQQTLLDLNQTIYNLKQSKKLLVYEDYKDDPRYKELLGGDYSNDPFLKDYTDCLGQEELAMYAFLRKYSTADAASQYIVALQDTINRIRGFNNAAKWLESLNANGADFWDILASDWEGFIDGNHNFIDGLIDLFGGADGVVSEFEYEMQYKAMLLSESNKYNSNLPNWFRQLIQENYSLSSSIGNMTIPTLVAFLPIPGARFMSSALMGLSAAGNAIEGALQQGASPVQAYLYGALTGFSEAITERLMGGIPGLSNLGESFFKNCVKEGFQEFLQENLDGIFRATILGEPIDINQLFSQSIEAGIQGMLISALMQGGHKAAFKIGDEIVYWSNSDYNSLTEMLTSVKTKNEQVLMREVFGMLKNDGKISNFIRNHYIKKYVETRGVSKEVAARMVDLETQTYNKTEIDNRIEDLFKNYTSKKQLDSGMRESRTVVIDGQTIITNLSDAEIVKFVNDNSGGRTSYTDISQIKLSDGTGIPINANFVAEVVTDNGEILYKPIWPPADGYTTDASGKAIKHTITLTKGQQIDRYGSEYGSYVSPMDENGIPYEYNKRSLPYDPSQTYSKYEITCDKLDAATIEQAIAKNYAGGIEAFIEQHPDNWSGDATSGHFVGDTYEGDIAGWFGYEGGGKQIELPLSIKLLLQLGLIKKVN